ncbi:hypothetical protein GCM10023340_08290 [Nocardioides marinquilinus]|uniref:Uncharacterized protein n=1 Tax=Nocardioides marinquilinus TaxID=1210400 RepID=A0ABP9PDE2_9ACTN
MPTQRIDRFTVSAAPETQDDELDTTGQHADNLVWRDYELPNATGGGDDGKILIRLGVDAGEHDIVFHDLGATDHLAALGRAIDSLARIRAHLQTMYGGRGSFGRCLAYDARGERCLAGVSDPHRFPVETSDAA